VKNASQKSVILIILAGLFLITMIPFTVQGAEVKQQILDALSQGDTANAVILIENDIALDPSFELNYYLLGRIYEKRGKLNEALEYYETAVEKSGKFYEGIYALGLLQLRLGRVDEAEENFKHGLKKAKKMQAEFHNGLGLVYLARGDLNEADKELRQAIIENPEIGEFHVNLGDVNFANKIYPLAIAEYEKALELDTASLNVYFQWAEACLELKDYSCALEKLRIVLQKDSTHADAWMKAGGIYYKAARSTRNPSEFVQRFKETIGAYRKYFELSQAAPDSITGRAYYETGMAYVFIGGYAEARQYFHDVLSIPVEPKDIYFYLGRTYANDRENPMYDSALTYYNKHQEWVEAQGEDYKSGISENELYRRMGECYQGLKDHYNTVTYFKKSLEYDSTQARLLYGVAVAYNYTGDYVNALDYYMKRIALGIDSAYWSIYYNAATSALYLAEKGGAAMMEEEDLGLDDDPAPAEKTNPLMGIDLPRLAVEYLEKVIEFKPDYLKAYSLLGSTYLYQLSECEKGIGYFKKVLELEPQNCEALKSLGYAYFGGLCQTNFPLAMRYLNQADACFRTAGEGGCDRNRLDIALWTSQAHQFHAIDLREAKKKEESKKEFKAAYDGYLQVLECDPNNSAASDGRDQVKFEY